MLFLYVSRHVLPQPEAVVFLGQDAIRELEVIGASRIRNLAYNEAWALISHTPFRPSSGTEHLTNTTTTTTNANNNNNHSENIKKKKYFDAGRSNIAKVSKGLEFMDICKLLKFQFMIFYSRLSISLTLNILLRFQLIYLSFFVLLSRNSVCMSLPSRLVNKRFFQRFQCLMSFFPISSYMSLCLIVCA